MASEYDWHPGPSGQSVFKVETRNLGWWVLLAILLSVIVHVILYLVLGAIERSGMNGPGEEVVWRNTREQITIDQDKLNELLDEPVEPETQEPIEPEKTSEMDLVDESLDEFDLMEEMKDETIRMSPVETPKIFSDRAPTAPAPGLETAAGASMDVSAAGALSRDLEAMRNKLIDSSSAVAASQPVMELNQNEDLGDSVDTDEFFRQAASKALGDGADEVVQGYSSLDGMISRTGGLPSGEEKVALPTDILFEFNEYQLKESARLSMMKLAYVVQTNPDATFVIEGHTDSIGTEEANLELSRKRAEAVRQWLVERLRIAADNIRTVGLGESEPIAPVDGTREEQALNRRVEIVVKKP